MAFPGSDAISGDGWRGSARKAPGPVKRYWSHWEADQTTATDVARTRKLPLDQLVPYLLADVPRDAVAPPIVWRELFGNDNPLEIEVGFGKGLFLASAG